MSIFGETIPSPSSTIPPPSGSSPSLPWIHRSPRPRQQQSLLMMIFLFNHFYTISNESSILAYLNFPMASIWHDYGALPLLFLLLHNRKVWYALLVYLIAPRVKVLGRPHLRTRSEGLLEPMLRYRSLVLWSNHNPVVLLPVGADVLPLQMPQLDLCHPLAFCLPFTLSHGTPWSRGHSSLSAQFIIKTLNLQGLLSYWEPSFYSTQC